MTFPAWGYSRLSRPLVTIAVGSLATLGCSGPMDAREARPFDDQTASTSEAETATPRWFFALSSLPPTAKPSAPESGNDAVGIEIIALTGGGYTVRAFFCGGAAE